MMTSTGRPQKRLFSVILWNTILTKSLEQILTTTQHDTTCTMNYYYNSDRCNDLGYTIKASTCTKRASIIVIYILS